MSRDSKERPTPIVSEPDPGTDSEGLLGRWSRRKNAARTRSQQTTDSEATAGAHDAVVSPAGTGSAQVRETPRDKTDAEMPPLESLHEDSDYSAFFSPKVSETLRRQALRRLFTSAQFNVLDGLDDYDDDFRTYEALGDLITADMRHGMEREAERAREALTKKAGPEAPPPAQGSTPGAGRPAAAPEGAEAVAELGPSGAESQLPPSSEDEADQDPDPTGKLAGPSKTA